MKEIYENNFYNDKTEINLKFDKDINLICNKYMKIYELKKLILKNSKFNKFDIKNKFKLIFLWTNNG